MNEKVHAWLEAVDLHTSGEFQAALNTYAAGGEQCARTLYNMACAHIRLFEYGQAIQCLAEAVDKDNNLAIAFFQRGTLQYKLGRYSESLCDWERALGLLRGNSLINYTPLGMVCRLHISQILYNLGLAMFRHTDGEEAETMSYFQDALHDVTDGHRNQIKSAILALKAGKMSELELMSICPDRVFRPPKHVTSNLEKRVKTLFNSSTTIFAEDGNSPSSNMDRTVQRLREQSRSPDRKLNFSRSRSLNEAEMRRKLQKLQEMGQDNFKCRLKSMSHSCGNLANEEDTVRKIKKNASSRKSFKHIRNLTRMNKTRSDSTFTRSRSLKSNWKATKSWGGLEKASRGANTVQEVDKLIPETEENISIYRTPCRATNADSLKETDSVHSVKSILSKSSGMFSKQRNQRDDLSIKSLSLSTLALGITPHKSLKRDRRSTGDLNLSVLPLEPKQIPERSSFTKTLKSTLISKKQDQHSKHDFPQLMMQGFESVNTSAMIVPLQDEDNESSNGSNKIKDSNQSVEQRPGENNNYVDKSSASLGKVCGDRTTVVKYALSEYLDVGTAVVTPIVDSNAPNKATGKPTKGRYRKHKHQYPVRALQAVMDNHHKPKSKKKRKAPQPPRLADSLKGTCDFFTAFVKADFDAPNAGRKATSENEVYETFTDNTCEEEIDTATKYSHEYFNGDEIRLKSNCSIKNKVDLSDKDEFGEIKQKRDSYHHLPETDSFPIERNNGTVAFLKLPPPCHSPPQLPRHFVDSVQMNKSFGDNNDNDPKENDNFVDETDNAGTERQDKIPMKDANTDVKIDKEVKKKDKKNTKGSNRRKPPSYPPPPLVLTQMLGQALNIVSVAVDCHDVAQIALKKVKQSADSLPDTETADTRTVDTGTEHFNYDIETYEDEHGYMNVPSSFRTEDTRIEAHASLRTGKTDYLGFEIHQDASKEDTDPNNNTRDNAVPQYTRKFHIPQGLIDI